MEPTQWAAYRVVLFGSEEWSEWKHIYVPLPRVITNIEFNIVARLTYSLTIVPFMRQIVTKRLHEAPQSAN